MMPSINSFHLSLFTALMTSPISHAFVQKSVPKNIRLSSLPTSITITKSSSTSTEEQQSLLSISLDKPLGMILEEIEEGQPSGVFISELADDGSAAVSQWKDQVVGLKLATVMGNDVRNLDFDSIMDQLIAAPSPLNIEFVVKAPADKELFPVGTVVLIKVLGDKNDETVIEAKVGDNLRQALLENNMEVYKGQNIKIFSSNLFIFLPFKIE